MKLYSLLIAWISYPIIIKLNPSLDFSRILSHIKTLLLSYHTFRMTKTPVTLLCIVLFFTFKYICIADYCGWDTDLLSTSVPHVNVLPWNHTLAHTVLEKKLEENCRTLTPAQLEYVLSQIHLDSTALYVELAVRVVASWPSYETNPCLEAGVTNIIMQILNSLESDLGEVFVRAAFGFITYAVDGLTDNELMDLLSLHEEVMSTKGVNDFNYAVRLPSHVWLILRGEVYGLLLEREGGRLGWFHRQFKEAAQERYKEEKQFLHEVMSRYFGGLISEKDVETRRVMLQKRTLTGVILSPEAVINHRRCVEADHHMLAARLYDEAKKEICCIEAVYARAKCGKLM